MVWIIGYDPIGEEYESDDPWNRSWLLRHGSPFSNRLGDSNETAIFLRKTLIPCLDVCRRNLDAYIFYAKGDGPPESIFSDWQDDWQDTIDNLTIEQCLLVIEMTDHNPFGSNLPKRFAGLHDHVEQNIPTVYSFGRDGTRQSGENRGAPGHQAVLEPFAMEMIELNQDISLQSVIQHMDDQGVIVPDLPDLANTTGKWISLFCRILHESYSSPCVTVLLPTSFSVIPQPWKYSGNQLGPLYNVIQEAMDLAPNRFNNAHPIIQNLAAGDEIFQADNRARSTGIRQEWDRHHQQYGFPPQSFHSEDAGALPGVVNEESNQNRFHPLRMQTRTDTTTEVWGSNSVGDPLLDRMNAWIEHWNDLYDPARNYGPVNQQMLDLLNEHWSERELFLTYNSWGDGPHSGPRQRTNAYVNPYLNDFAFCRNPVEGDNCRRVNLDPMCRRHFLINSLDQTSLGGAFTTDQVYGNEEATLEVYRERSDIILLSDGGYVGELWWETLGIDNFADARLF